MFFCFFFFSSRRRHTRSLCDWSSDVCSSDLAAGGVGQPPVSKPLAVELQVNAKGRLVDEEEFGQIIVKTGENGEKTLLRSEERRVGKECRSRWWRKH